MDYQAPFHSKTREQLASEYGITRRTFYNWLKKADINLQNRALITPKELQVIYDRFGRPNIAGKNQQIGS